MASRFTARGYLIDEFLSGSIDWDDEYGGPLENRLRFPSEVARSVRAAIGSLPLSYNLSLYKMDTVAYQPPGGEQELRRIVEALSSCGVDVFHVSTRGLDRCRIVESDLVNREHG